MLYNEKFLFCFDFQSNMIMFPITTVFIRITSGRDLEVIC